MIHPVPGGSWVLLTAIVSTCHLLRGLRGLRGLIISTVLIWVISSLNLQTSPIDLVLRYGPNHPHPSHHIRDRK